MMSPRYGPSALGAVAGAALASSGIVGSLLAAHHPGGAKPHPEGHQTSLPCVQLSVGVEAVQQGMVPEHSHQHSHVTTRPTTREVSTKMAMATKARP